MDAASQELREIEVPAKRDKDHGSAIAVCVLHDHGQHLAERMLRRELLRLRAVGLVLLWCVDAVEPVRSEYSAYL